MAYLLGVDAGNSKTVALVARLDGAVVGAGRSGCGDIYGAASADAAMAAMVDAATAALAAAGRRATDLLALTASAAGADWPEDFQTIRTALADAGFACALTVVNDAIGALRAGSPDGTGVVVACGTGAATGARAADGRTWHSSFWQQPQGSVDLARQMLRAVYRSELDLAPATALTRGVIDYFEQPSIERVLHRLTARSQPRVENLGGLARVLLAIAAEGDPTARRIVAEHGAALGDFALVAARQVGIERTPFPLVLTGGVLRHPSPLLRDAIVARVHTTSPDAQPRMSRFEPVVGALLLTAEQADILIDGRFLATLAGSMPPAAFFDTA